MRRLGTAPRQCDNVVQGRAADPQVERGARLPDPVRSRGRGLLIIKEGDSSDTKHYLPAREWTCELFGKARMVDDGAGCREPTCPRRTQAKTPAA